MKFYLWLIAVFSISTSAFAATIQVPAQYSEINQAIAAASDGDTVLVSAGTYLEKIDFLGKTITVKSVAGPDKTVIDGDEKGSVVSFRNGEGPDSILEGFTITGGTGTPDLFSCSGGGIYCRYSSPTIRGNDIQLNKTQFSSLGGSGGGIYSLGGNPLIEDNTIVDNTATEHGGGIALWGFGTIRSNRILSNGCEYSGGGIYLSGGAFEISNNEIMENGAINGGGIACIGTGLVAGNKVARNLAYGHSEQGHGGGILCGGAISLINNLVWDNDAHGMGVKSGWGGGIYCYEELNHETCTLLNNTIVGNYSDEKGGGVYLYGDHKMWSTIVWNNTTSDGPDQVHIGHGNPDIEFCNVEHGWSGKGNIDADPRFVNPSSDDYHLTRYSPCINMGTPAGDLLVDMDGDARPFMGSPDMGADEFTGSHVLAADLFALPHNTVTHVVNFMLDADAGNAGRDYLILSSISGNAPGFHLPGGGAVVPVNWDIVTDYALWLMHLPYWTGFLGSLDAQGQAAALFTPNGILTGMMGYTMSFAFVLAPSTAWDFASNPINLRIDP